MTTNLQQILIRRKSKVFFDFKPTISSMYKANTSGMVGAIIGNFGSLGYVPSDALLKKLQDASTSELKQFYTEVYPVLQEQVGDVYGRYYRPMYPNFPEQVANASDEELFINAILHYFGDMIGERITPEYEKDVRFPFCESYNPRFIGIATADEVDAMWCNIFESKASPSLQDKQDIDFFLVNADSASKRPTFQNKEKMAYTLAKILQSGNLTFFENWGIGNIKTATDVLRIAVAISGGDESLTKVSKFGKFSRPVRKHLLGFLNRMNQDSVMEDMNRFKGMWIRLGEKLHPSEYTKQYPSIASSFDILRNDKIETTNSKIEKFLASSDWQNLLSILKTRPGDFARRINAVFSKASDKFAVIDAFKTVSDKVSTPVLWQLHGYFKSRDKQLEFRNRIFLPKTPNALVSENNLVPLSKGYQTGMVQVIEDAIKSRYTTLPELGKVYVDPICMNLLIPSGNRSTSTALRQVGRGSRFQLSADKSTVRLFVYWKDVEKSGWDGRVDLDLSAIMFDKDFKYLGHCSWTKLREGKGKDAKMVHSGDITSAPNGASEFLDINLDKLEKNVAYIASNVYCYTGQKMNQLDVGYMGWMEREYAGSGEIYEPKSVVGRCDLTADATSTCPLILDVKNREIIWTDLAIALNGYCQTVEGTMDKSIATAELATRMSTIKSSLFDVFFSHVNARGGLLVDNKEDADFVIAEDGDVSPYDIAKIMAEWV